MFGWFKPSCPLGTHDKVWVERRMLWLADQFGIDRLLNARVVLPTDEFFPDPYAGDWPSARLCLERMCRYMGVPPTAIRLDVRGDEAMSGAAGQYEMSGEVGPYYMGSRSIVRVATSQLATPALLLATLGARTGPPPPSQRRVLDPRPRRRRSHGEHWSAAGG